MLVNNAGPSQLGTIACVSMESTYRQFEVNVFGYPSLFNNTPWPRYSSRLSETQVPDDLRWSNDPAWR